VQTINTTRTTDAAPEDDLVDEIVEAFGAMRARGMRGIQGLHRGSMSVGHLQVLIRLRVGGSLPVSRLAETLGISAAGATGMVGRMEERGLVERVRDVDDRRVVLVRLTAKGDSVLEEIGNRGRASLRRVLARLDGSELRQLRNGLVAFQRAARELAEGEAGADEADDATAGPTAKRGRDGAAEPCDRAAGARGSEAPDVAEDPE